MWFLHIRRPTLTGFYFRSKNARTKTKNQQEAYNTVTPHQYAAHIACVHTILVILNRYLSYSVSLALSFFDNFIANYVYILRCVVVVFVDFLSAHIFTLAFMGKIQISQIINVFIVVVRNYE